MRLRLLSLIASHDGGEACVCDLSGPTISHHLTVLREAGLIIGERRGTWTFQRVQLDALRQISTLVSLDEAGRRSGPTDGGLPPARSDPECLRNLWAV